MCGYAILASDSEEEEEDRHWMMVGIANTITREYTKVAT